MYYPQQRIEAHRDTPHLPANNHHQYSNATDQQASNRCQCAPDTLHSEKPRPWLNPPAEPLPETPHQETTRNCLKPANPARLSAARTRPPPIARRPAPRLAPSRSQEPPPVALHQCPNQSPPGPPAQPPTKRYERPNDAPPLFWRSRSASLSACLLPARCLQPVDTPRSARHARRPAHTLQHA